MKALPVWKNYSDELVQGLLCTLGSLLLALGMTIFLQPNQIASGGTPGMAILLGHLTGLTAGTLMLLINIPLLIVACFYLGQKFVWRTVIVVTLISALVDLFNEVLGLPAVTNDPILAAAYGGAAIGCGVGLILKGNASAGGPTIIARIVASRSNIRPGRSILVMDALIVAASAVTFGAVEPALLSMLSIFVTGRCIDFVLRGTRLKTEQVTRTGCSENPA